MKPPNPAAGPVEPMEEAMNVIVTLLILLLVAVIAFYIIRLLPLDAALKNIVMLIVGVIILIALLYQLLPLVGMPLQLHS